MTEFGIKLRTLRALKGISRQQLASALGWPITTLGIYERDRIPEPHKVEAIAKFFGVSPCWMLCGEDAMGGNTLHKIPIIPPAYASQWKEAINNFDDTYNEWPALVVACPVGRHTYALEVATTSMAPVIPPGVCVVVEPEM